MGAHRGLERVTPEGVALQQLDQARRAVTQLEHFNTELIFSLEKALDEKIAGRLSPQLERLVDAVEGLREDRSSDAGQMIEQALGRFTDAMQERTGSQFEEMASIVADLNRTLKDSAAGLAQSQQEVRVALESVLTSVRTSMDSGANAMTETLQQALGDVTRVIADASRQLAEQMTASSAAASAELRETVGSATLGLARTGVEAAAHISGSLNGLQASAESLDRSTRQSEQVLAGMTMFVDRLDGLRDSVESAHRQIAEVAEPVGRAASVSAHPATGRLKRSHGRAISSAASTRWSAPSNSTSSRWPAPGHATRNGSRGSMTRSPRCFSSSTRA